MAVEKILITIEKRFYTKLKKKAKQHDFPSVQQYLLYLAHCALDQKRSSGRPKGRELSDVDILGKKHFFAKRRGDIIDV